MKKITACFATTLGFALCSTTAFAISEMTYVVKVDREKVTETQESILSFGVGNCLPLEAVIVTGDRITVRTDCDTVVYGLKSVVDVMENLPAITSLVTIGFSD